MFKFLCSAFLICQLSLPTFAHERPRLENPRPFGSADKYAPAPAPYSKRFLTEGYRPSPGEDLASDKNIELLQTPEARARAFMGRELRQVDHLASINQNMTDGERDHLYAQAINRAKQAAVVQLMEGSYYDWALHFGVASAGAGAALASAPLTGTAALLAGLGVATGTIVLNDQVDDAISDQDKLLADQRNEVMPPDQIYDNNMYVDLVVKRNPRFKSVFSEVEIGPFATYPLDTSDSSDVGSTPDPDRSNRVTHKPSGEFTSAHRPKKSSGPTEDRAVTVARQIYEEQVVPAAESLKKMLDDLEAARKNAEDQARREQATQAEVARQKLERERVLSTLEFASNFVSIFGDAGMVRATKNISTAVSSIHSLISMPAATFKAHPMMAANLYLGAFNAVLGLFSAAGESDTAVMLKAIGEIKENLEQVRTEMRDMFRETNKRMSFFFAQNAIEMTKIQVAQENMRAQIKSLAGDIAELTAITEQGNREEANRDFVDLQTKCFPFHNERTQPVAANLYSPCIVGLYNLGLGGYASLANTSSWSPRAFANLAAVVVGNPKQTFVRSFPPSQVAYAAGALLAFRKTNAPAASNFKLEQRGDLSLMALTDYAESLRSFNLTMAVTPAAGSPLPAIKPVHGGLRASVLENLLGQADAAATAMTTQITNVIGSDLAGLGDPSLKWNSPTPRQPSPEFARKHLTGCPANVLASGAYQTSGFSWTYDFLNKDGPRNEAMQTCVDSELTIGDEFSELLSPSVRYAEHFGSRLLTGFELELKLSRAQITKVDLRSENVYTPPEYSDVGMRPRPGRTTGPRVREGSATVAANIGIDVHVRYQIGDQVKDLIVDHIDGSLEQTDHFFDPFEAGRLLTKIWTGEQFRSDPYNQGAIRFARNQNGSFGLRASIGDMLKRAPDTEQIQANRDQLERDLDVIIDSTVPRIIANSLTASGTELRQLALLRWQLTYWFTQGLDLMDVRARGLYDAALDAVPFGDDYVKSAVAKSPGAALTELRQKISSLMERAKELSEATDLKAPESDLSTAIDVFNQLKSGS